MLLQGGCHAPPIVMPTEQAFTHSAMAKRTAELWTRDESTPNLRPGDEVAILECSVEFITMKHESPGDNQPMIGGPIGATSALVDLSGVFRKRVDYPSDFLLDFPREVHDSIVFVLEENGISVTDPNEVAGTFAYEDLVRSPIQQSWATHHLNPMGSDAGRVTEFRVYPSWPLRVLHESSDSLIDSAERAVRMELAADATLRLRLRVGIYQGRVSIDQGSEIIIAAAGSRQRIVADRSVVSGRLVAHADEYEFVSGQEYIVDWPEFRRAIHAMLPAYLTAGLPLADDTRLVAGGGEEGGAGREFSLR